MAQKDEHMPSCSRCGDSQLCPVCKSRHLVKNGKTKGGKQRYSCKRCKKWFVAEYAYNAYLSHINLVLPCMQLARRV
jgi:insertion element IS1 protein InsB